MRMATDPAVFSVEPDCYRHINSFLPESGDSSPGQDSPDLYDEVARRLSVQSGAPWGIDRIDTDGEPSRLAAPAHERAQPQHSLRRRPPDRRSLPSSLAPGTQAARSTACTMMAT